MTDTRYEFLAFDRRDEIAILRLDRPDVFNSWNAKMREELRDAVRGLVEDDALRVLIVTGTGRAFSAGEDVRGMGDLSAVGPRGFRRRVRMIHNVFDDIEQMEVPVIAAINGVAAGGGFSLALASDFRVMARSARLKQGFTSNALCIDGGATFTLPRLVGLARALEIAAFDEPIEAEQALAWGLVTKVVDDGEVVAEARRMVHAVAKRSLHTFGWSKQLLTNSSETPLEAQLECERQGLLACVSHPDGVEGMTAFLEKRPAVYNR